MFGYILPERAHLYMKDFDLYRCFYCGICKSMEKQFGQFSRFTINYDVTFLAILIHNYLNVDVEYEKLKCITKPFTERKNVKRNDLTDKLAALNVILAYYSAYDKVLDDKSVKAKSAMNALKSAKKKADKVLPKASPAVEKRYGNLNALEKSGETSVDKVAHEFAEMMRECVIFLTSGFNDLNSFESFGRLCYNVGKWIYLIDALDDFEKDKKSNSYNVFIKCYEDASTLKELMEKHGEEVVFTFTTCLNKIAESFEAVKFHFNTDFIKNVIYKGMPLRTKGVMRGEECKKTNTKFLA